MFDGRIISGITIFIAVAETGSYARAGERVGLSRSGIGKAIARLEERTGKRLFDRTSRALKLTNDGRTFLEEVMPLLEKLGRAAAPATADDIRGRLRVTCDAAFGTYLLIPALDALFERHPRLKVEVLIRDRTDNLLKEGVDLAVRFGQPDAKDIDKQLLLRSRVVTCASPAYVERYGVPSSPDDLLDGHRCVRLIDDLTGKPHAWHLENAAGEGRAIACDGALTVADAPSLMAAIASSFGIGRVLDFMVADDLHSGRLIEILPEWNRATWPAYIYSHDVAHGSAAMDAFRTFVASHPFKGLRQGGCAQ